MSYQDSADAEVEARLAAEVDEVLSGRDANVEDLPRLSFTEHVVMEAMRLYPPACAIGREALHDREAGGYSLAAGMTVLMSPWVVQRCARYYDNPTDFRPGRWDGTWLSVSPASPISRSEVVRASASATALRWWRRLEWQVGDPIQPFASLTLRPKGGVWIIPTARKGPHTSVQLNPPLV